MSEIQFTPKEQLFINNIMKPFTAITKESDIHYYEFIEHTLNQRLHGIIPDNAKALVEGIVCKLAMHRADIEIEKMLTDPTYGEGFENTKAASHSNLKNLTPKHDAILEALGRNPNVNRRELASILGWPINSVTPRVCELIDYKKIKVSGVRKDEETNQKTQTLIIV
jgi:hypothetical protein